MSSEVYGLSAQNAQPHLSSLCHPPCWESQLWRIQLVHVQTCRTQLQPQALVTGSLSKAISTVPSRTWLINFTKAWPAVWALRVFFRTFFGSEGSGTPWLLWAVFILARLEVCLGAFRGNFAGCSGHKSKPRDPFRVRGGTPLGRTELVPGHH